MIQKRVLILMVAGGGGHESAAKAIRGALQHKYGDRVDIVILDPSKRSPFAPLRRLDDFYRWMSLRRSSLYRALWATDGQPWVPELLGIVMAPLYRRPITEIMEEVRPDLIVSVHGLTNHIPLRILRHTLKSEVPFVTVVTDMIKAHPIWFCRDVDLCLVPTEEARERGLRFGMPADKIEVVGQPVDLAFTQEVNDKAALRTRLGLDPERPCVLIVGGGDGVGPMYETACAFNKMLDTVQLIVIAGHNEALKRSLHEIEWQVSAQIHGFVHNMPELMQASDLLVTKAGPGTLAEAFAVGLPVIIFDYIPGQEEGNVRYVLEHGAGVYTADPAEIVSIAQTWLQPGNPEVARILANAAAIARPDAIAIIADRLGEFLTP
ncbi:MAG: glycosyltransferase [Chloroflexi bacterium]|nr:glycosyltransferase [Chloroflexota bacterium]